MQFLSSALILASVALLSQVSGKDCMSKFKNFQTFQATTENCIKTLNLTEFRKAKESQKPYWDDKCLANCTLSELNLMKNSTLNKEALTAFITENAPAKAQDKLIKIAKHCMHAAMMDKSKQKKGTPLVIVRPMNGTTGSPMNFTTGSPMNGTTGSPMNFTTGSPMNGTTGSPMNFTTGSSMNGTTGRPMNGTAFLHMYDGKNHHRVCGFAAKFVLCFQKKQQEVC